MKYDQQLHPYIVDGYGRTDSTPPRLLEEYGSREAIMAEVYAWAEEQQRPERERQECEAREAEEAERQRIAEVLGRGYPDGHVVYYLRFCCRVKIGMSRNLAGRLLQIPHDELLAVEPGEREVEAARHRQFNATRVNGEWFEMTSDLFQHLLSLRGGKPWTHMPDSWIRGTRPSI